MGSSAASAQPRPDDLLIREQFDLALLESADGDGVFNADGTVNMILLRPCNGRGIGQRIYEADVLERDAGVFKGLTMYDNHDAPAARKARAPFPRPLSEVGGVIRESFWDGDFTTPEDAEFDFGKGAVVGRCMLSDEMEAIVRKMPEVVKTSVNMQATSMRMGSRGGKRGWLVEGLADDPENSSVDLVTKAGAGGRVRSLLESLYDPGSETSGSGIEGIDMGDMTLQEALQTPEVQSYIGAQAEAKAEALIESKLDSMFEARENELRESIREEVREELGHTSRWRGLHTEAARLIEAAKLPTTAKANLLEDYGLTEEDDDTVTPGRSLALIEAETDSEGKVTKAAKLVLKDAIEEDVKRVRNVLREAAPSVPVAPGANAETAATGAQFGGQDSAWAQRLKQRGLDPAQFGATKPAEPATTTTE